MKGLSPAERQKLKGKAHKLDPVVFVGADGLSASVIAEIDRSLKSHELIKVRVSADRDEREAISRKSARRPARSRCSTSARCWCCSGRIRKTRLLILPDPASGQIPRTCRFRPLPFVV
jgi:RNA-binding protein